MNSKRKGSAYRHILRQKTVNGRIWSYHATKGWRSTRA